MSFVHDRNLDSAQAYRTVYGYGAADGALTPHGERLRRDEAYYRTTKDIFRSSGSHTAGAGTYCGLDQLVVWSGRLVLVHSYEDNVSTQESLTATSLPMAKLTSCLASLCS